MAWEDVEPFLREEDATLVDDISDPLTGVRTIRRQWQTKIPEKLVSKCLQYLDAFTSVTCAQTFSFSVPSPKAIGLRGLETYSGTWRAVQHEHVKDADPGLQGVMQTLRYGFRTTIDWTEGRIASSAGYPDDKVAFTRELYLTVQIHSIDPSQAQAIQEQILAAESYTGITIGAGARAITLAGQHYAIKASPDMAEDGSVTINILLAKPQCELNGYVHYGRSRGMSVQYRWGVPKVLAQGISDAWKAAVGLGASCEIAYRQGLCDMKLMAPNTQEVTTRFLCAWCLGWSEWEGIWWDHANDTDYTIEASPHYGDKGWTIRRSVGKTMSSPNWDIHLYERQTTEIVVPQTTEEISVNDIKLHREYKGAVTESGMTLPNMSAAAQGVTNTVRRDTHEDDSEDVIVDEVTSIPATVAEKDTAQSAAEQIAEKWGFNILDAGVSAFSVTNTAGEVQTMRLQRNRDGSFQLVRQRQIPKDQTASSDGTHSDRIVVTAAETRKEERHTAAAAIVPDPTLTAGTIVDQFNRPLPAGGLIETNVATTTVHDQTATGTNTSDMREDSGDETLIEEIHTAADAALADVNVAEGVVVNTESRPLPFKDRFMTRKTTRIGKCQAVMFTWLTKNGTAWFKRVTNATAAYLAADTDLSGLTQATSNHVSGNKNKLNLYDYQITCLPIDEGGSTGWAALGYIVGYVQRRRYRRILVSGTWTDQKRKWVFRKFEQYCASYAAAKLAYQNGFVGGSGGTYYLTHPYEPGSGLQHLGGFRWKCTVIELDPNTSPNPTAWATDT